MTCSLFVSSVILGVSLSLFPDMSKAEFFQKYGLIQPAHLDVDDIKKLERRYEKCVTKFNSLDRNLHNDQIPKYLDIPSTSSFLDNPSNTKNVQLWPDGKIPTVLDKSVQTGPFEKRLRCAVLYFLLKTCIRFIKKEKHHNNYLLISNNGLDCSSDEVGVKGGQQTVILGGTTNCWRHGTIVHELLHVVGQFHEHQRHDRDEHIDIIHANIPPSFLKQFETIEQMGYHNYDDIGKYDFSSVMHYGSKFGNDRVMVAKYSKYLHKAYDYTDKMGNRKRPTDIDTSKVNELYQCNSSTKTTTKSPVTNCDDQLDCTGLSESLCSNSEAIRKRCKKTCGLCDQSEKDLSIKVLLIGGYESMSSMEYYYPSKSHHNSLINVTMIKPRRYHTSVVMSDGKIMTMGGEDGNDDQLNDVEIFDPTTNTLTRGPNMKKARQNCDSAIMNGIVYVCGGRSDRRSCERYQSGVWEYITSMNKSRHYLRLISLDGYLYAIGGDVRSSSVEKYNPNSNSWLMVKSMQAPRGGHGAAVLHGFIYVCNGWNEHSCERYDPTLNKWSNISKTIINRGGGLRMVSDGQHLFALGGENRDTRRPVEMYDPKKDKWIMLKKPLIHGRWYSSAVVLH